MLFLVADENFNNMIVRGLLRVKPDLDIVRIQDVGLFSADDPTVLEWAANEDRILLTHDVTTITKYAYDVLMQESTCRAWLKSVVRFHWVLRLMKFYILRKYVIMANWKGRLFICH